MSLPTVQIGLGMKGVQEMLSYWRVFLIVVSCLSFALAQDVSGKPETATQLGADFKPAPSANIPFVAPNVRAERDAIFDNQPASAPSITDPKRPGLKVAVVSDYESIPELPVSQSNTIVVGEIQAITSHFGANQRTIYTEWRIAVREILETPKTAIGATVASYKFLDAVGLGGSVRTADGKLHQVQAGGQGDSLEKESQYLFFLKARSKGECFQIIKAWKFESGKTVAISIEDKGRTRRGQSTVANMDTKWVLDRVRELVRTK